MIDRILIIERLESLYSNVKNKDSRMRTVPEEMIIQSLGLFLSENKDDGIKYLREIVYQSLRIAVIHGIKLDFSYRLTDSFFTILERDSLILQNTETKTLVFDIIETINGIGETDIKEQMWFFMLVRYIYLLGIKHDIPIEDIL